MKIHSGDSAAEIGRGILDGITADEKTIPDDDAIDAEIKKLVDAGVVGNTVTLSNATDAVSTTSTSITDGKKTTSFNDTISNGTCFVV